MEAKVGKSGHVTAGPWGGDCGSRWDDGAYSYVRQVIISYGTVIDSIQIEYDAKGRPVWSEKHGGYGGGGKTEKVKLDHPDEYLVSISGYLGAVSNSEPTVVVRSLGLESNKRRFGPYGLQKGTSFSFSMSGGRIVGFHGRSGSHLDSLGVYLKPFVTVKTVQAQVGLAHAGMGAVVGGNRGFDVMLAVREKMDNMDLGNYRGSNEFERKENKILLPSHEDVKGNQYHRQEEREKESYTFMTSSGNRESDRRVPITIGLPMIGHTPNERLPKKGNEALNHDLPPFTGRYETNEKVYGTIDGEKGHPNTRLHIGVDQKDHHFVPSGFSEYETREHMKTYGYGSTGAEKGHHRQTGKEGFNYHMKPNEEEATFGAFTDYESKGKVYTTHGAQNHGKASQTMGKPATVYGPWGGSGGMLFDEGVYTGVREIHVARSVGVVYIRVCYDMNGKAVWGDKNGGNGAIRLDKISLDYPEEYLTRVSGYYGSTIFRGPTVIKSITFHTNKMKYGPFGDEQGIPFSSPQKQGMIIGFHGRKGWLLDSIGVHFLEGKHSFITRPSNFDVTYSTTTTATTTDSSFSDQVLPGPVKGPTAYGPGMVKETAVARHGPWGGNGGSPWDDGVYTGIKKIILTRGEAINGIQIEYDRNGHSVRSAKHGNNEDGSCHVIQFEYPQEVVTCMSGYYGSIGGDESKKVVKSLTFHTNKGKYGPYGEEIGTHFTIYGKIVGFIGKSGCYLYAIGVHTRPDFVNDRVDQPGPIKMMLNKIFA